ncbi:MAG: hypothetical protein ABIS00_15900 [Gemmatimonadales bacterium]
MSLIAWQANRGIVPHEVTTDEITELFAVVDRDLADAAVPRLSADWQLGIGYNAALQLATLALAAAGYRPVRERAHERAILSLEHTVGTPQATINLLDAVRRRRNIINYERAGTTSDAEAAEVLAAASALRAQIARWLRRNHPTLLQPS